MRTKHVLMAMALPALFAACTSDEFMEQPAQGNLDGRAVLGNLQVNVAEDAATRFAWDVAGWTFQDGDQFGAAVTDPTELGTVENGQMLGNYIFSKNGNGYTTTSQMVEGTYLFYSYNQPESFVNKNTRDLIKFDLTTQTADLNDPEKAVSDNQLFISPLYFIEAENTTAENTIALPLRFIPYYSTAAFRIKNSTGAAFSISQIVLNGSFVAKGEINPKAIKDAKLYYSVPEGGDAYELTALNPDGKLTEAKVEEAYKAAYGSNTANFVVNGETTNSLVLDCNDYELANGKEIVAYMQVPVGKQTNMSASIIVKVGNESKEIRVENAARGNATEGYVIASNGIATAEFTRTATKAVFGVDGQALKVLDVKKENLREAGGFYVRDNAELLEVLAEQRGDIKIYNVDEVKLNDELIEYMNSYYAGNVTFANPISIEVEDAEGLSVDSKVTFMGDVTVESGIVTLGADVIVSNDVINATTGAHTTTVAGNVDINVKSGKLVLAGVDVQDAALKVEGGELEVAGIVDGKAAGIAVEKGTLNFTSSQKLGTNFIESVTFNEEEENTLKVTAPAAALTGITLDVYTAVILNEETSVEISAKSTVKVYNDNALKINGKVVNNGTLDSDSKKYELTESGSISNNGVITGITNNGVITMENKWDSKLTLGSVAGSGYVNNTVGAVLNATGNKVYSYNTGSISSISSDNVDVIVLHNAAVADDTELILADANTATILLLGNNTFGTNKGMTITAKGATMQIGLKASGDTNEAFARKVANIATTTTATAYSASMVTTFNKCTVQVANLNSYGGSNRNDGTIEYKTSMDNNSGQGGTWTTVQPTQNGSM